VFEILIRYEAAFLAGLAVTLKLTGLVWTLGLALGTVMGVAASRLRRIAGYPLRLLGFVLSGIPILVLLFWLHYPAQAVIDIVVPPFYTAALTLTLVNTFGVTEIVREALSSLPREFLEAAQVSGLSRRDTVLRIQLPLILRHVVPALLMLQVGVLHMTLFASLISVEEIFRVAQRVNAQVYRPIAVYSAVALFFLLISLPLNGVALTLRRKYARDFSER
jgi:His/Glu/Gln/Arg/opine family amino acid ABC transporter permease subunit